MNILKIIKALECLYDNDVEEPDIVLQALSYIMVDEEIQPLLDKIHIINLGIPAKKHNLTTISGYKYGIHIYDASINKQIKENDYIMIYIPKNVKLVTITFIDGLFNSIINSLGIKNIKNNVIVTGNSNMVIKIMEKINQYIKYELNSDNKIVSSEDPSIILGTLETIANKLRKDLHCDFECIYNNHPFLTVIYKCKECGTIIFSGDDERYDPHLRCPNCSDYKHSDYWTPKMIESDPIKQKQLQALIEEESERRKDDEIWLKRGKLYNFEVTHPKKLKFKNTMLSFQLRCDDYPKHKLKGLYLNISCYKYNTSYDAYAKKSNINIPLSLSKLIFEIKILKLNRRNK